MEPRDNRLTFRADLLASKQASISSASLDFFSASSEVARYASSDSSTGEGVDSVAGSADFCASPSAAGSAMSAVYRLVVYYRSACTRCTCSLPI